jgi:hypothetical protein
MQKRHRSVIVGPSRWDVVCFIIQILGPKKWVAEVDTRIGYLRPSSEHNRTQCGSPSHVISASQMRRMLACGLK